MIEEDNWVTSWLEDKLTGKFGLIDMALLPSFFLFFLFLMSNQHVLCLEVNFQYAESVIKRKKNIK